MKLNYNIARCSLSNEMTDLVLDSKKTLARACVNRFSIHGSELLMSRLSIPATTIASFCSGNPSGVTLHTYTPKVTIILTSFSFHFFSVFLQPFNEVAFHRRNRQASPMASTRYLTGTPSPVSMDTRILVPTSRYYSGRNRIPPPGTGSACRRITSWASTISVNWQHGYCSLPLSGPEISPSFRISK